MESSVLKRLLSHFGRHAFEAFVVQLFGSAKRSEPFNELTEAGGGAYYQPILDSYGGSLHSVFLLHYSPLELLNDPGGVMVTDPQLIGRATMIRDLYKGQIGYWGMVAPSLRTASRLQSLAFVTNLGGIEKHKYEQQIIPAYEEIARKVGLKKPRVFVGSYDSFVELDPAGTDKAISKFITESYDGIGIALTGPEIRVERIVAERNLAGGALRNTLQPFEPVFSLPRRRDEQALAEFERLIEKRTSEAELEKFLVAHYKLIFGTKYDRVETQLWLKFPELDIAGSGRSGLVPIFETNS